MNKKLVIKSDDSILKVSDYCGASLDDKTIEDLVKENLPADLKTYTNYPVRFKIEMEFIGTSGFQVETQGYAVPSVVEDKKKDMEDNENE